MILVFFMFLGNAAFFQGLQQGPLTPPPKREIKRLPGESVPEPPPVSVEELIQRFTQKEDELIRVRNASAYRISLRLQEFDEEGKPAGEFQSETDIFVGANGRQYQKRLQSSPSTIKRLQLPDEELADFIRLPPFMLPSTQLANYELTYAGKQPVDELTAYVFRIRPRRLERNRPYFEGVIYVDDRDLAIVKSYGRMVAEVAETSEQQPFKFFEVYRENVDGKYWLPSFMRAEEVLRTKAGDAKLRLTLRYLDYKTGAAAALPTPPKQ
jgi:hypothetical protein